MTLITEVAYAICAVIGASVIWMLAAGYRDHFRCKRYQLENKMRKAMNKQKTIREWLQELPDGYRERALKNYDPNYHDGYPINDLADAIVWAFCWKDSPERHEFWCAVYDWANGELPPLPEEEK